MVIQQQKPNKLAGHIASSMPCVYDEKLPL